MELVIMSGIVGRRILPQLIMVVVCLVMILEFFTTIPGLSGWAGVMRNSRTIIGSIALGLGAIAALRNHGGHVIRRTPGRWLYSAVLLTGMVTMAVTGLIGWYDQPIFRFIWDNVTVPAQQTVYSLLMFYIAFAAYRALRATNVESSIFTICALTIMITNAPLLEALLPPIAEFGGWIFQIPNVGAARAYSIAATVGSIALYIRTLLGRELGMLGVGRGERE
jgi:hypothetical protein